MFGNDPFARYRRKFTVQQYASTDVLRPAQDAKQGSQQLARQQTDIKTAGIPVSFPAHLYIPEGAQSIDMRRVCLVGAGTSEKIITFTARPGSTTRFISYAVYNDGDNAADYEFRPTVNGSRIFPFHGDPNDNFKINLGLAPDLSDVSLIECQLAMNPGDVLVWEIFNNSAVDTEMGVRMKGYLDTTQRRVDTRFGG